MEKEAIRPFLAQHPYFRTLSPADLTRLVTLAWSRQVERDEIIALEGEPCTAVYLVVQGRIKAIKASPQGREQVISVISSGQSFYVVPALDGGALPVTTQAATRAKLVAFAREDWRDCLDQHPGIAAALLVELARRLRRMSSLVEDLALRTVPERLARLLIEQVNTPGHHRVTQREMAEQLGTVREVVARSLAQFERQGLLRLGRGAIEILDLKGLRHIASWDET